MKYKHDKTHQPTGYLFLVPSVRPEFAVAVILGMSVSIGATTRPDRSERIDNKQ